MTNLNFIGVTVSSPLVITDGRALTATGLELLRQSLIDRLNTPLGSVPFRRGYGSRLHLVRYEPQGAGLTDLLRTVIGEAIQADGRAEFKDLETVTAADSNGLIIKVYFRVNATGQTGVIETNFNTK